MGAKGSKGNNNSITEEPESVNATRSNSIVEPEVIPEQKNPHELPKLEVPEQFRRGARNRRVSVSAEVDKDPNAVYVPKVVPKSDASRERIQVAMQRCFLFANLDRVQVKQIIDSMEEKKVEPGDFIIKQGDGGDYFYVIESGKYDVWKRIGDEESKVFAYDEAGFFGELALMYNCPRAATVVATTPGTLWSVDRQTFRHIVIAAHAQQRKTYEEFLNHIPILKDLTSHERSMIADCLERKIYQDGELVIRQGDSADRYYLIERGEAVATQNLDGKEVEVGRMGVGQYFGERALITNQPRAANVTANGELVVAAMDRAAFERLLGDRREQMMKQIHQYQTARQILEQQSSQSSLAVAADPSTASAPPSSDASSSS